MRLLRKRLRGDRGEDLIQINAAALTLLRGPGSPETMFELDHADCRHHDPLSLRGGGDSRQQDTDRLSQAFGFESRISPTQAVPTVPGAR